MVKPEIVHDEGMSVTEVHEVCKENGYGLNSQPSGSSTPVYIPSNRASNGEKDPS